MTLHYCEECLCGVQLGSSRWEEVRTEVVLDEVPDSGGNAKVGRVPVHHKYHPLIRATVTSQFKYALQEWNEFLPSGSGPRLQNWPFKHVGMTDTAEDSYRLEVLIVLG